ncbi:hypothetical protein GQ54DRAFT_306183 [Martensiomyces pterosporus]|nr:hypothetical protein GQ54DRAFT_306183 [Martensiomyces pterosporus]
MAVPHNKYLGRRDDVPPPLGVAAASPDNGSTQAASQPQSSGPNPSPSSLGSSQRAAPTAATTQPPSQSISGNSSSAGSRAAASATASSAQTSLTASVAAPTTSATSPTTTSYNPCSSPTQTCSASQAPVLVFSSSGSCSWVCQADPQYRKSSNAKKPIIGGSLGAMVFVLFIILTLLVATRYKRKNAERKAYLKDTADLADELSGVHLLDEASVRGSQSTGFNNADIGHSSSRPHEDSVNLGIGAKLGLALGIPSNSSRGWKAKSDVFVKPLIPGPEEAGTELTMDIVDRPIETDTTLATRDGSTPYRQEKTADAYPLLSQFSLFPHSAATPFSGLVNESATSLPINPNFGFMPPTQSHSRRKGHRPRNAVTSMPVFESPEEVMLRNYEAARSSGDAALAAAQESARLRESEVFFNPFNAVPSIRSSPTTDEAQSLVSRKRSDRSR